MRRITKAFSELQVRANLTQAKATPVERIRWVVNDKDKFKDLILQLSEFVAKLNSLVPNTSHSTITIADFNQITRNGDLRLILDATSGHQPEVESLAAQRLTIVCQDMIQQRIWFRFMGERKDNVAAAHPRTLQWAFNPPNEEAQSDSLSHWLRWGDRLYWVSGKPGRGKSTLMKYVCDNQHTIALLNAWACGKRCRLSSFFFWYRGRPEHRSQEGLLRALLYNIIYEDLSLIPILLPNMWRDAYNATGKALALPSTAEMQVAFEILAGLQLQNHFCFVVDGLDEYEGDYQIGIRLLELLATNHKIKVVVASRPVSECFEALSKYPKLCMQDLNRPDILTYVEGTLGDHPQMQDLRDISQGWSDNLLRDVVNKASGVFLWVILACRTLTVGLGKGDGLSDLQTRLEELPPELEEIFDHILGKIEPRYHEQTAKLLHACYTLEEDNKVYDGMPVTGLSMLDSVNMDIAQVWNATKMLWRSREIIYGRFHARLRSRCWGLLEIHDFDCESVVVFMHRTVYDFLATARPWSHPTLQIRESTFDTFVVLQSIHLWSAFEALEDVPASADAGDRIAQRNFAQAIHFATRVSRESFLLPALRSLQQFLACIQEMPDQGRPFAEDGSLSRFGLLGSFNDHYGLLLAVELGLVHLVRKYAEQNPVEFRAVDKTRCFLYYALSSSENVFGNIYGSRSLHEIGRKHVSNSRMIELLCTLGCHPNQQVEGNVSPWDYWVRHWEASLGPALESASQAFDVLIAFLSARPKVSGTYLKPESILRIRDAVRPGNLEHLNLDTWQKIRDLGNYLPEKIEQCWDLQSSLPAYIADIEDDLEQSSAQSFGPKKRRYSNSSESDIEPRPTERERSLPWKSLSSALVTIGNPFRTPHPIDSLTETYQESWALR